MITSAIPKPGRTKLTETHRAYLIPPDWFGHDAIVAWAAIELNVSDVRLIRSSLTRRDRWSVLVPGVARRYYGHTAAAAFTYFIANLGRSLEQMARALAP